MSKILLVGEAMIDKYVYGDVTRISPEAPIPILKIKNTEYRLGGAANVASNLKALGANFKFVTIADFKLENLMALAKIPNVLIKTYDNSIVKTRYIGNNQYQILRVDNEPEHIGFNDGNLKALLETIKYLVKDYSIIVISDYNKGMFKPWFIKDLMTLAMVNNIRVIVDTKQPLDFYYEKDSYRPYLMTPNYTEFTSDIYSSIISDHMLVTCGSNGMVLDNTYNIPASKVTVADVSGAGDTVIATIASCLAKGASLKGAAYVASIAAGIVVSKPGTAVCDKNELELALKRGYDKIYNDLNKLGKAVENWKKDGFQIVFTNGVFDLLHEGHYTLLKKSKNLANKTKLIVGINSDQSVKRLKGSERPINLNRIENIAAIPFVDAVIEFTEDTPENVISYITPDYITKGGDYAGKIIVGADLVKAYGGQVVLIPFENNISTTKLVNG